MPTEAAGFLPFFLRAAELFWRHELCVPAGAAALTLAAASGVVMVMVMGVVLAMVLAAAASTRSLARRCAVAASSEGGQQCLGSGSCRDKEMDVPRQRSSDIMSAPRPSSAPPSLCNWLEVNSFSETCNTPL